VPTAAAAAAASRPAAMPATAAAAAARGARGGGGGAAEAVGRGWRAGIVAASASRGRLIGATFCGVAAAALGSRRGAASATAAGQLAVQAAVGRTGTLWRIPLRARTLHTVQEAVQIRRPPVAHAAARANDQAHGWTCVRIEELSELRCSGAIWRHDKTGAELLSIAQPSDENKTFGVVFRTPPESSNGIAHVLEHSVLCGSQKYPVKEPFVELLKGSMQTFLNALTFPDRTCYPVASCNLQDFYNLIDVYLDAVFHPRALEDPRVLAQEGWHYEVERKGEPLIFKGVVFNEMKGVYSDPDSVQSRLLTSNLMPDTPYGFDSGGDPKEIPDLTFEYFKDFHNKYYHPSNAKFWFYGDDPPEQRLEILDEYLRVFTRSETNSEILPQPLWKEPRRMEHNFAVGADEDISKKAMALVSWVLSESKPDAETSIALHVLNYVLVGTPSAPLRRALTDSGLGSRVIGGGLYDGLAQSTFSTGLKDIREADAEAVERLVLKTLTEVLEAGFEREAVEAALNIIEFRCRELNTGGLPRGVALMFAAVSNWNYDKDPFESLRFDAPLMALRRKLIDEKQPLLESLLRERFLDNAHRLTITSKPSFEEGPRLESEEKERLKAHRLTLTDDDLNLLIDETLELKRLQETPDPPEALALVPQLALSDLPRESPTIPTTVDSMGSATVLRHPLLCSGIVYVDVAFDLRGVPASLLPLLPLFCRGLREMGTKRSDFSELQRRIDIATGGISAAMSVSARRDADDPSAYLVIRGKARDGKVEGLLDLMAELATEVTWENRQRFVQLAREARAGGRSQLLSSGHVVAANRLARPFTVAGWASEQMSGLSQFEAVGRLLAQAENEWESVELKLQELQAAIFRSACVVNLTADEEAFARIDCPLEAFLGRFPRDDVLRVAPWVATSESISEGIIVPSQVNYVSKGTNLYRRADYKLHGSAVVTSRLLGTTWLWDRVRVSGGAYGGFCSFDVRSGDFKYLSYRDPNLQKTLDTYDGTAEFLRAVDIGTDELTKSIIGTVGDIDQYQLPDAKGHTALIRHLLGETDEMRQEVRDQILGTTPEDIRRFADSIDAVRTGGVVCVVGGEAAVREAASALELELISPFAADDGLS